MVTVPARKTRLEIANRATPSLRFTFKECGIWLGTAGLSFLVFSVAAVPLSPARTAVVCALIGLLMATLAHCFGWIMALFRAPLVAANEQCAWLVGKLDEAEQLIAEYEAGRSEPYLEALTGLWFTCPARYKLGSSVTAPIPGGVLTLLGVEIGNRSHEYKGRFTIMARIPLRSPFVGLEEITIPLMDTRAMQLDGITYAPTSPVNGPLDLGCAEAQSDLSLAFWTSDANLRGYGGLGNLDFSAPTIIELTDKFSDARLSHTILVSGPSPP